MPEIPQINLTARSEVLIEKLYLMNPDQMKHETVESLEMMIEYWELWMEAVAGKQIFNLLEIKAAAEEMLVKKRHERQEWQKYMKLKRTEAGLND